MLLLGNYNWDDEQKTKKNTLKQAADFSDVNVPLFGRSLLTL
jgi:hypothetical protein